MKGSPNSAHTDSFEVLRTLLASYSVPPAFATEAFERHIPVNFEKGAIVFGEGSADDMVACVLSGYVKVYCPVVDGSRTLMRLATPGELIGYEDYRNAHGRPARMFETICSTKCTLALVSRDHITRTLRNLDRESLVDILESLNLFWSARIKWYATLLSLPFWIRLETVLADLGARAGVKDSRGIILLPELAHEDLAEMIGCSRPMVSRIVGDMRANDLIDRNGRNFILLGNWNLERLPNHTAPSKLSARQINNTRHEQRPNDR